MVIIGAKDIDANEFASIMAGMGGHKSSDEEFSFSVNDTEFIVYFDNENLAEFEDEDMGSLESRLKSVPQSCIIFECQTGTPIEKMREFLVKTAFAVRGVVRIDDIGTFSMEDIECNRF